MDTPRTEITIGLDDSNLERLDEIVSLIKAKWATSSEAKVSRSFAASMVVHRGMAMVKAELEIGAEGQHEMHKQAVGFYFGRDENRLQPCRRDSGIEGNRYVLRSGSRNLASYPIINGKLVDLEQEE